MQLTRSVCKVLLPAGLVALWAAAPAWAQSASSGRVIGNTLPSARSQHSLRIPDIVMEIPVKPGDKVRAGQVLLVEDDREELIKLELTKMEADSDVAINAAKVTLENKKVELDRVQKMYADKVASEQELLRAQLEVELARLEIEKAELEKALRQLQVKQQKQLIDEMRLVAKIDGVVEELNVKLGEVVDPQKPAITIGKNEPLWVEFHAYSAQTMPLTLGQELDVYYNGESQPRKAKVIYLAPTVDPRSDRHLVRLELPNPEQRPSGLRVEIALPAAPTQTSAKSE